MKITPTSKTGLTQRCKKGSHESNLNADISFACFNCNNIPWTYPIFLKWDPTSKPNPNPDTPASQTNQLWKFWTHVKIPAVLLVSLGIKLQRDFSPDYLRNTFTILHALLTPAGKAGRWFHCICKPSNCVTAWATSLAATEIKAFISL